MLAQDNRAQKRGEEGVSAVMLPGTADVAAVAVGHPLGRRNMMQSKRRCTFGLIAAAAATATVTIAYMNRCCQWIEMMLGGGADGGGRLLLL